VNRGRYQYVSCKVRPDDTIAHIGFLGAIAPSVKGLGVVSLSADDSGIAVELSQADLWVEKSLFRRMLTFVQNLRDQVVAEKGVEAGDKIISNDEIGYFQTDIDNLEQDTKNTVTSLSELHGSSEETIMDVKEHEKLMAAANARIAELSESISTLTAANTRLTGDFSALQVSVKKAEKDARTLEFSECVQGFIDKGKLPKAEKEATVELMERLFLSGEIELSEDDGKTKVKKSATEYLKKLLGMQKPSVDFTEHATQDRVGQATELSEAAELSEAMSKHIAAEAKLGHVVTVVEALQHVKEKRS
jgi:hypothetical protein